MERTSGYGGPCLFLATLLATVAWSTDPQVQCTAATSNCSNVCEAPGICSCNEYYGRCTCVDEAAALLLNGRCISATSQPPAEHDMCTKENHVSAEVLLVAGTTPSPEMSSEDLATGHPSSATSAILHWCAASAVGVTVDKISLSGTKLLSNHNYSAVPAGLLFFDIHFSLCAEGVSQLVRPDVFERRWIKAWESFAAFPVSTVRVLEFQEAPNASSERQADSVRQMVPLPPGPSSGSGEKEETRHHPTFEELVWIGPATGIALLLLILMIIRLVRHKYKNKGAVSSRQWRDITSGAHVEELPISQTVPQTAPRGPGGGSLASVAYDFDPNSAEGFPYVVAAGLEASECLSASKGDLLEAFARGDDWLYGRLVSNGLFGYLPEPCVLWIDAVGGELREAGVAASTIAPSAGVAVAGTPPTGEP